MLKNTYKLYKYKINNQITLKNFIITPKTSIKNSINQPIIISPSDINLFNHFNLNPSKYFISS